MKLKWLLSVLFLAVDLFYVLFFGYFSDNLVLLDLWYKFHMPVSELKHFFIALVPSHGGGIKALIATISYFTINIIYFFCLGYLLGLLLDKLMVLLRGFLNN